MNRLSTALFALTTIALLISSSAAFAQVAVSCDDPRNPELLITCGSACSVTVDVKEDVVVVQDAVSGARSTCAVAASEIPYTNVVFMGSPENDTFRIAEGAAFSAAGGKWGVSAYGGDGNDTFFGTPLNDNLSGGAGHDILRGLGGDDHLNGDAGDDFLYGSAGRDVLRGGEGADALYGGAGPDKLLGGGDVDVLNGDAGDDELDGGAGRDEHHGGEGDNRCIDCESDTRGQASASVGW